MAAGSIALMMAGCTAAESEFEADLDDESEDVAARQATVADINPVMVTSGTCRDHGFRPIADEVQCLAAQAQVVGEEDPGIFDAEISSEPEAFSEHGCSITASVTEQLPNSSLLRLGLVTTFQPGTADELDAQTCTHDVPCVCADDVEDDETEPAEPGGASACKDGVFDPDPNKYYAIRSPNGRYLRYAGMHEVKPGAVVLTPLASDATEQWETPAYSSFEFDQVSSPDDSRLQWRFVNRPGGGYDVIGRAVGMPLGLDASLTAISPGIEPNAAKVLGSGQLNYTVFDPESAFPPDFPAFSMTCKGNQVVLEQGGRSPLDLGGFLEGHPHTTAISSPFVHTGPTFYAGTMIRRSGCERKSTSCQELYGEGFYKTGSSKCGVGWIKERKTCQKDPLPPLSMYVPQAWYVEEVTHYKRALDFDPSPVSPPTLMSHASMADSLATFSKSSHAAAGAGTAAVLANQVLAKGSGPLYGALFSIGFNAMFDLGLGEGLGFFEQPDPVADLADEVETVMTRLKEELQAETADLIDNAIAHEAAVSLDNKMGVRRDYFYGDDEYLLDKQTALFGTADTGELAGDLASKAFEFRVDIGESFPEPDASPDELAIRKIHFVLDTAKLAMTEMVIMSAEATLLRAYANPDMTCEDAANNLAANASAASEALSQSQDALIDYGNEHDDARQSILYAEFEFDVKTFSYPIEAQLEFFESIVGDTVAKCERLRDPEDEFRTHFENNTIAPPPPGAE